MFGFMGLWACGFIMGSRALSTWVYVLIGLGVYWFKGLWVYGFNGFNGFVGLWVRESLGTQCPFKGNTNMAATRRSMLAAARLPVVIRHLALCLNHFVAHDPTSDRPILPGRAGAKPDDSCQLTLTTYWGVPKIGYPFWGVPSKGILFYLVQKKVPPFWEMPIRPSLLCRLLPDDHGRLEHLGRLG